MMAKMDEIRIGILSLSDRASAGIYEDKATPKVREVMQKYIKNELIFFEELIPDDLDLIVSKLKYLTTLCDLIITCGGTGPAARDNTPEATEAVCEKILPGFGELMRLRSLDFVPTAILSRQIAGVVGKSLIINLPGNPRAIEQCLEPIFPAVPYCIDLIGGPFIEARVEIFSPKK